MIHRASCRPSRIIALACVVAAGLAAASAAQGPSKPAGPPPLARYFPRQDLVVYAEFDGLDAHRDAWKQTATYRVLTETTTGAMLEQTLARLLDERVVNATGVPGGGRPAWRSSTWPPCPACPARPWRWGSTR